MLLNEMKIYSIQMAMLCPEYKIYGGDPNMVSSPFDNQRFSNGKHIKMIISEISTEN